MNGFWMQEHTWEEIEKQMALCKGTAIVPVGSTEQHGPHLPTGTDAYAAIALADDASARTGAVVTPPLWFGWSPHHLVLPGTISVRAEVLTEVLYDIISSLHKHGGRGFVVVNGHRIVNIPWMQLAAQRAQENLGVRVSIFDPAYMSKEISGALGFGPIGHAEEAETSHMLFKYPELCKMEKAFDFVPAHARPFYSVDPSYPGDTQCYVPSTVNDARTTVERSKGTAGRPTSASAEKGVKYHDHLVARLVSVIEWLKG